MRVNAPAILKNKYVLYVLLFLAVVTVLGYVALQDYNSLALFVAMGLLSTYFSKNMAVNLLVAMVVTSLVAVNNKVREGFEDKKEGVQALEEQDDSEDVLDKVVDTAKMAAVAGKKAKKVKGKESESTDLCADVTCKGKGEKCDPASGKCVSGFQNNVPPSSPAAVDDDESVGDRIDYAATMEQAYDNLQKMLGDDGMKSITHETKKLVSQQKDLMKTLNSMAPVLTSAKETLATMDLPNMGEMGKILNKLSSSNLGAPSLKKK